MQHRTPTGRKRLAWGRVIAIYFAAGACVVITLAVVYAIFSMLDGLAPGVCGHTHMPYDKTVAGTRFVNVGSAGKPKDGDPRGPRSR